MKKVIIPNGLFVGVLFSGLEKAIEHRFIAEEDSTDEVKKTLLMCIDYSVSGSIAAMKNEQGPEDFENVSIKEDVVLIDGETSNGIAIYEGIEYPFSIKSA